jgi:hypothetical protein
LPIFQVYSSNLIEADNLVDCGAANRARPILGFYVLQAGHAESHMLARNTGTFHCGIQTYNTSAPGITIVGHLSFAFHRFTRACVWTLLVVTCSSHAPSIVSTASFGVDLSMATYHQRRRSIRSAVSANERVASKPPPVVHVCT